MVKVYAWPPVGVVGQEWTIHQPVSKSRSLLTGATRISAAQRPRRLATLEVSALAAGRMGAGYMEALKELLEGGVHLVRLTRGPINWWLDEEQQRAAMSAYRSQPLSWQTGAQPLAWQTGAQPLVWYTGTPIFGAYWVAGSGLPPRLQISGLPASRLVTRPLDLVTVYSLDGTQSAVVRARRETQSGASGWATIHLLDEISWATNGQSLRVNIGEGVESRVFEVDGDLPRAVQPVSGDWKYTWSFREVYADERGGSFEEINPWT